VLALPRGARVILSRVRLGAHCIRRPSTSPQPTSIKARFSLGEPKRRRDKAPWWQDLDINALAIAKGLWEQSHTSKSSMQEPVNDLDVRKANFGEPS
jgi:hypothetical protein